MYDYTIPYVKEIAKWELSPEAIIAILSNLALRRRIGELLDARRRTIKRLLVQNHVVLTEPFVLKEIHLHTGIPIEKLTRLRETKTEKT